MQKFLTALQQHYSLFNAFTLGIWLESVENEIFKTRGERINIPD